MWKDIDFVMCLRWQTTLLVGRGEEEGQSIHMSHNPPVRLDGVAVLAPASHFGVPRQIYKQNKM
jgi:hypothetical protein